MKIFVKTGPNYDGCLETRLIEVELIAPGKYLMRFHLEMRINKPTRIKWYSARYTKSSTNSRGTQSVRTSDSFQGFRCSVLVARQTGCCGSTRSPERLSRCSIHCRKLETRIGENSRILRGSEYAKRCRVDLDSTIFSTGVVGSVL